MKRILFILLCVVCAFVAAQAQSHYRIYAYTGKVEYKPKNGTTAWQPVRDGMTVGILDTLRIPQNASARVEHVERHMIYTSQSNGDLSIYQLVREAKNQNARNVTQRLNKEMASGTVKPIDKHAMRVVGIGTRGGIQSRDSIAKLADMFAWIGAQACSGAKSPKIDGVVFKKNKVFREWDFVYENHTDKDYFMNVLHVNKLTGAVSLCYVTTSEIDEPTTCPIVPGGYCQCGTEVYFPISANDVYILIATELAFDTEALDNELARHPIDKAKNTNFDVKYMW